MSIQDQQGIQLQEKVREYTYPGGDKVTLHDVEELIVRPSGDHRLKTKDGSLHIIPKHFIHIQISGEEGWTL